MFEDVEYKDGHLFRKGRRLGHVSGCGYEQFYYEGSYYYTHRVVWYLHNGVWPSNDIDHIDQDRLNNRIENLRDVTRSTNLRNQRRHRGYHKRGNKWRAQYNLNKKTHSIGTFNTEEEARQAYLSVVDKL